MKKGLFHHFYRAFIKANKTIFLEGESPTLRITNSSDQQRV